MSVMSVSGDPPVSARRAQTRSRLMTAAVTVFAEKGIAGASVEELCEAAGFTRGAFYSNFESKDELCFALQRSLADSAMAALQTALTRIHAVPATVDELIEIAVDTFLATQAQNPTEALLVKELELYALRHPDFGRTYVELQQSTVSLFADLIEDALRTHNRTLALPSQQVIEILHAVQRAAQTSELLQPDVPSPVATQLTTLVAALVR